MGKSERRRGGIVLVLDPGMSTGWCVAAFSDDGTIGTLYAQGFIDVDCTGMYEGDHCRDLMKQIKKIILKHSVTEIAHEAYFFSKRFATGSTVNAAFRAAIQILARSLDIPYVILGISDWKRFVAGRATATPQQKKLYGPARAKKIFIQEALWTTYGIRFPNHSLSKKTGKPVGLRLDIVDVVAQAIYYCFIYRRILKFKYTVKVPKDAPIKSIKLGFVYPEKSHKESKFKD